MELARINLQINEVMRVADILETEPWKPADVLYDDLQNTKRLHKFELQMDTWRLEGKDGTIFWDETVLARQEVNSPFWLAVQDVKDQIYNCLICHHRFHGKVAMANGENDFQRWGWDVPGGDGQVHIVFPLVTLLFATFDTPMPMRDTVLWDALHVRPRGWRWFKDAAAEDRVPIFQCLDLRSQPTWDLYNLKLNLRNQIWD
jgi:hypothetical protein